MDTIQEYDKEPAAKSITHFNDTGGVENTSNSSLLLPILRRWRIVLVVFLLVCAVGIPVIWLIVKPFYCATAAIRVTPVISSILFSGDNSIPMYKNFMYTQADLITSDKVLQRVADDLIDKNPDFFKKSHSTAGKPKNKHTSKKHVNPIVALRGELNRGNLRVLPEKNTELIKISMKNPDTQKCAAIVNAFLRAYMAIVVSEEAKGEDHKLTVLENERRVLSDKLQRQRQTINEMAQEYGTQSLTSRQEMMLRRVAALQAKLTEFEMDKITLKVKEQLLRGKEKQPIEPEKLLRLRYEFTNSDLMVRTLTINVANLDQGLIVAKQQLAPTNPQLHRKARLLETLKQRLETHRQEVDRQFDEMVAKELIRTDKNQLRNIKEQLKQIAAYEEHLKEVLSREDTDTIELGRKQLAIQDLQDQLNLTRDIYETVRRRIQELEMERKRPARVSEAYYANTAPFRDNRVKYTLALMFAAMAMGAMMALVKDKIDQSVYTPQDIVKTVGVRVIGTTTCSNDIKKSLLPQQIAGDYQAICTNLGLYYNEQGLPAKLVVTSPGPKEGKTTLAINVAINIAKTGKKVLLIDGDLRKPQVAQLLNLPLRCNGLKLVLLGKKIQEVVCQTSLTGLHVLPACACKPFAIYRLMTQPRTSEIINRIAQKYDHLIIDSPPVLAFSDALLWAKMADAVILTSFAGHTEGPELRETLQRFAQINAKVIGMVLNNVRLNYSYNSYGYGYYANINSRKKYGRHPPNAALLPMQK